MFGVIRILVKVSEWLYLVPHDASLVLNSMQHGSQDHAPFFSSPRLLLSCVAEAKTRQARRRTKNPNSDLYLSR